MFKGKFIILGLCTVFIAIIIALLFFILTTPIYPSLNDGDVIVGIGDSITAGGKTNEDFAVDEEGYFNNLGEGYFKLVSDGLQLEVDDLIFYNSARNGTTAMDWFDEVAQYALNFDPSLIIMTLGANDFLIGDPALYREAMDTILREISESEVDAVVVLPFAMIYYREIFDLSYREAEEVLTYRNIALELAEKYDFETVDIGAIYSEHVENGTDPRELSEDGIHPTDLGEEILAQAVLETIKKL